jgi:hypothetical protein
MRASLAVVVGLVAFSVAQLSTAADGPTPKVKRSRAEMVARVNELVRARWTEAGIQPARPASDTEFLRRASLDLDGVVPRVPEVRSFLADTSPDKRDVLLDTFLSRPAHFTHLANTWRDVMLPGDTSIENMQGVIGFQRWLRGQFADNRRYDQMVADLLVASGNPRDPGPALFYTATGVKAEDLAASTSRIFLGVQIQCAQCHDHPFDHWKQRDFWGYAAFFSRVRQSQSGDPNAAQLIDSDTGEVMLPDTEEVVSPKYLGSDNAPDDFGTRREQLAIWLASRNNPYFAPAAVNRVWSHLFGRGLVEPVDDLSPKNPASHPELLEELSWYFVHTGFDLRELFRTLAATEAYQLSSRQEEGEADLPPELFARMAIKNLTAEQLYDSLLQVALRPTVNRGNNDFGLAGFDQERGDFVARFESNDSNRTEYQAGIPQALTLMNGRVMADTTDPDRSSILAALEAPFMNDGQRIETLFLAALTRFPTDDERQRFTQYVAAGGATGDRRQAISDVLWSLLNSGEFGLNH